KYLSGEHAFESVSMVLDLCNQKFGTVLEDRLAILLKLEFAGGQPLWRHQPTPAERFMEGWSEICKEQGQPEYRFQPQEVRELTGFTYTMRLKEIDELLAEAEMWMVETDGEKTLLQFLYEIQEKP